MIPYKHDEGITEIMATGFLGRIAIAPASRRPPDPNGLPTLRGSGVATITTPWHSERRSVHHNNKLCDLGNNIEPWNVREGGSARPIQERPLSCCRPASDNDADVMGAWRVNVQSRINSQGPRE